MHRFSRKLVDTYQNIVIGDVSSLKLVKTPMAKSVLDSGWGILRAQLQYKSQQAGRSVFIVNEKNTTRECSSCHALTGPTGLDMLAVSTWLCSACGGMHDRNVNAAKNEYGVRVEVVHVRQRKRAIAVSCVAEPGISPARGKDQRTDGGGMNTGENGEIDARIASVGHAVFAAMMTALGILGLVKGDFTAIWLPVPKGVPVREVLAYVCAVISLASGIGLLWQRAPRSWRACCSPTSCFGCCYSECPSLFLHPRRKIPGQVVVKRRVIVAGARVLYAWFAADWDGQRFDFATGDKGLRMARTLYGLVLIPFGIAHFVYINETAALVPRWLPSHLACAYLTGCAYIAAALSIVTGVFARLAAALSALRIGMFTLLVWIPIVVAGTKNAFQWSETTISLALTAGAWVVADSYRPRPSKVRITSS